MKQKHKLVELKIKSFTTTMEDKRQLNRFVGGGCSDHQVICSGTSICSTNGGVGIQIIGT